MNCMNVRSSHSLIMWLSPRSTRSLESINLQWCLRPFKLEVQVLSTYMKTRRCIDQSCKFSYLLISPNYKEVSSNILISHIFAQTVHFCKNMQKYGFGVSLMLGGETSYWYMQRNTPIKNGNGHCFVTGTSLECLWFAHTYCIREWRRLRWGERLKHQVWAWMGW